MAANMLSEHLSRAKGRARAVGSGRLGWPPGYTTRSAGLGASAFAKGPWTCRRSTERGLPSPGMLPAGVPIPVPHRATGPAAPGLGQCPQVFLVSILKGFAVKIALVGAVKLQKLVCYEATGGVRPLPWACRPEVAGAGGQGCIGAPLQVTASTVSPRSLKPAPKQPQGLRRSRHRSTHPKPECAGKHLPKPLPPGALAGRWWAALVPEARKLRLHLPSS